VAFKVRFDHADKERVRQVVVGAPKHLSPKVGDAPIVRANLVLLSARRLSRSVRMAREAQFSAGSGARVPAKSRAIVSI
jgi:hypothetical protein